MKYDWRLLTAQGQARAATMRMTMMAEEMLGTSGLIELDADTARDAVLTELAYLATRDAAITHVIYVDPQGNDSEEGTHLQPVATVTRAMALVSATRKTIVLAPGTYAEAAAVVWPSRSGVTILGPGAAHVSIAATGTRVFTIAPGVQTATWEGTIEGCTVDHSAGAAQSGLVLDNTGMTKKLLLHVKNCAFAADAATDKSIDVATHGDTANGIRVYLSGDGSQEEIEGAIYFLAKNNGDRLNLDQVWLRGVITTSADDVPMNIRIRRCMIPKGAATAGGHASQTITAVSSYGWTDFDGDTPETYAPADTNDFDGAHTEVIVA